MTISENSLLQGDCLDVLRSMPSESIDLVVTDPPYRTTSRGGGGTMSGYWVKKQSMRGKIFKHNDTNIEDWLPLLYNVLKPNSHCYIMCNNVNLPHFFEVIKGSEFHFVKLLVWDKQNKICGRYYMGQIEHIFLLRKGRDKPINNCGCSDLLSFPNKRDKTKAGTNIHDSQKPIPLMQCLIENSSDEGDLVLDPFVGSGTTALACIRSKRKWLGIELDEKYFELANERVRQELAQQTLF